MCVWFATATVAVRSGPVLGAAEMVTMPVPEPFAPDAMVSHGALAAVAVHEQPAGAVTVNVRWPPATSTLDVNGASVVAHPGAADVDPCSIVTVRPATAMDPLRGVPGLAPMSNVTMPLPFPVAPDLTEIQLLSATAVQLHPASPATSTVVVPPAAGTPRVVGVT